MKVIDLTVPLYDGLQSFPTHPKVTVIDHVTHAFSAPRYTPPCKGYASKLVLISDHGGTHLDAPFHFFEEGRTIDQVPLESTFGEAVLIDVSARDPRQPVTAAMLEERLAATNTEVKPGDIVLIRAWAGEWNGPGFHHAEALDISAAKWLSARSVKAIGMDLSNVDTLSNMGRTAHLELLGKNIGIMENLTNLDKLSKTRFFFMGIPLNIRGLSGSPIRALAVEEWQ
ncbi:MAG: cyclase family protein [Negativicutes bacterium]|nr:cyclase family protein [Negativicutes bacterium]